MVLAQAPSGHPVSKIHYTFALPGIRSVGALYTGHEAGLMKISDMETRFALGKGVIFVPVHVPS